MKKLHISGSSAEMKGYCLTVTVQHRKALKQSTATTQSAELDFHFDAYMVKALLAGLKYLSIALLDSPQIQAREHVRTGQTVQRQHFVHLHMCDTAVQHVSRQSIHQGIRLPANRKLGQPVVRACAAQKCSQDAVPARDQRKYKLYSDITHYGMSCA